MSKGKTKQMKTLKIILSFHNPVVIDKSGEEKRDSYADAGVLG